MKKLYLFLALALLAIGCQKPKEDPKITLSSPAEVAIANTGATETITFSSNYDWTASCADKEWVSLSPASGDAGTGTIKVTFLKNDVDSDRSTTVTIKAETASAQVKFTQAAKNVLSLAETSVEIDCNAQDVNATVLANVEFTAKSDVDWIEVTGTKAASNHTVSLHVKLNEGDAREGTVTITSGDLKGVFTVKQAAFVPVFEFESDYETIGTEGGDITYTLKTNVPYDVVTYDAFEDWFTVSQDGDTFKVSVKANSEYDPRLAYFKVVSTKEGHTELVDNDWDGIPETEQQVQLRAYCYQEGSATLAFSKNLSAYGVASLSAAGAIHRLGTMEGGILVSDGTAFCAFDGDGEYISSTECPVSGVLPEAMAVDAAGNLLFAQAGEYCGTFNIYLMNENSASNLSPFISYEHNAVYSNMVSNLRVYGDVTGDAVITAHTDLYPYCVYWEVKAGVPGEAQLVALPSGADWDTWSGIIWNANRNGCVAPLGATADAGFLFIAYDSLYTLYYVDKTGAATPLYAYDEVFGEGAGSNVNFQSISVREWNGKVYAAVGVSSYFSWGACPDVILFNVTDMEAVSYLDHTMFDITCNYVGGNDGENASADVCLIPEDEQLGVVMIDGLNDVIYRVNYPKK